MSENKKSTFKSPNDEHYKDVEVMPTPTDPEKSDISTKNRSKRKKSQCSIK